MKTVIGEKPEITEKAAERVISLVKENPEAVLVLGWDESLEELYLSIGKKCLEHEEIRSCFSQVKVCGAIEFDCKDQIVFAKLNEELLIPAGINPENQLFYLSRDPVQYETMLADETVICVVSVGLKGQICFNETGAQYNSACRRQKLTSSTRQLYAPLFGGEDNVPEYGFTAGIGTIVSSKNIIVFSAGKEFADAVFAMLYSRNDSIVPAAFLQLPSDVEVYCDNAAASKL